MTHNPPSVKATDHTVSLLAEEMPLPGKQFSRFILVFSRGLSRWVGDDSFQPVAATSFRLELARTLACFADCRAVRRILALLRLPQPLGKIVSRLGRLFLRHICPLVPELAGRKRPGMGHHGLHGADVRCAASTLLHPFNTAGLADLPAHSHRVGPAAIRIKPRNGSPTAGLRLAGPPSDCSSTASSSPAPNAPS